MLTKDGRAVCLSTNGTVESSGYRIPVGTDAAWFSESRTNPLADESRSADGWLATSANTMFPRGRAPQRHVEAYQQVPEPQIAHRQDADAYWADKIAEVMRDQFRIKPKVNTYSYRTLYPPTYDLIPLPNRYKVPDFTKFSRQDDTSTMEHVNRFIIQCGEATN